MFTAKHISTDDQAALYHWYPGQSAPQDVMVAVDIEDGEVSMRYNPEIGSAISRDEFEGTWRMAVMNACPTVDAANDLIDAVVAALNETLTDNGWEIGNFQPRGEVVRVLDAEVERVVSLFEGNTLHHLECDRDQELAVWDECGNYVCPAEEI
jgi:hypothetical protein